MKTPEAFVDEIDQARLSDELHSNWHPGNMVPAIRARDAEVEADTLDRLAAAIDSCELDLPFEERFNHVFDQLRNGRKAAQASDPEMTVTHPVRK